MAVAKLKKRKKVKTWSELNALCRDGDERWQKVVIGALQNLGCEHLAGGGMGRSKWERHYHGLMEYISALCSEYGESETKAEKQILAEVNHVRDCCDDIVLVDAAPPKGKEARGA